jgi:hypothetical protein
MAKKDFYFLSDVILFHLYWIFNLFIYYMINSFRKGFGLSVPRLFNGILNKDIKAFSSSS